MSLVTLPGVLHLHCVPIVSVQALHSKGVPQVGAMNSHPLFSCSAHLYLSQGRGMLLSKKKKKKKPQGGVGIHGVLQTQMAMNFPFSYFPPQWS